MRWVASQMSPVISFVTDQTDVGCVFMQVHRQVVVMTTNSWIQTVLCLRAARAVNQDDNEAGKTMERRGGWRDLEPSTLFTTTGLVSSYDLTEVLHNWRCCRSARHLVPRPRRRLLGDDEGSFTRTQYSIFLVTISPGEFIDSPFGPSTGEWRRRKRWKERRRRAVGLVPVEKDEEGDGDDGGVETMSVEKKNGKRCCSLQRRRMYVGKRSRKGVRMKSFCHLLYLLFRCNQL